MKGRSDLFKCHRNGTTFAVEPHVSGGVPVAATRDPHAVTQTYFLNDILGTTLAVIQPDKVEIIPLTAFGKPRTAKPSDTAPKAEPPKLSTEK